MPGDDPRQRLLDSIRERGVAEPVVAAVGATPREHYVPAALRRRAYDDGSLPLELGQTISQPSLVAQMTDALGLTPQACVLDVGTGSGYQAAILARLAGRVLGLELRPQLARRARRQLAADPGANRVELVVGDAHLGFPGALRFDAILVAAAAAEVPPALIDQLAPGGRLVAPVGPRGSLQQLVCLRRGATGDIDSRALGWCAFVPLVPAGDRRH